MNRLFLVGEAGIACSLKGDLVNAIKFGDEEFTFPLEIPTGSIVGIEIDETAGPEVIYKITVIAPGSGDVPFDTTKITEGIYYSTDHGIFSPGLQELIPKKVTSWEPITSGKITIHLTLDQFATFNYWLKNQVYLTEVEQSWVEEQFVNAQTLEIILTDEFDKDWWLNKVPFGFIQKPIEDEAKINQ